MLNQAQIIGRVGRDPELRYMSNGDAAVTLSIATSEKWKDKATGEQKEATEWHKVNFFGRMAEIAGEYLRKGSLVYVAGQIRTRKYTDKDGIEKYSTEITGREMKMLGDKASGDRQDAQKSSPAGSIADMDDDIPF